MDRFGTWVFYCFRFDFGVFGGSGWGAVLSCVSVVSLFVML
jgi:hypothetical protein